MKKNTLIQDNQRIVAATNRFGSAIKIYDAKPHFTMPKTPQNRNTKKD